MLYVIELMEYSEGPPRYKVYETKTDSKIQCSREEVNRMAKVLNRKVCGLEVGNETYKRSYNSVRKVYDIKSADILIGRVGQDEFKVIFYGIPQVVSSGKLKNAIGYGTVVNCAIAIENGEKVYKSMDTCDILVMEAFKQDIKRQYSSFIALTKTMGLDNSFEYEIEGNDVKLKNYTGMSGKVIVPKFITSIMERAFEDSEVTNVKLNNGLKYIGRLAFGNCLLKSLTIPESVQFLFKSALEDNNLIVIDGKWNNVNILNKNIIML